jgi:hypothetical protein
LTAFLFEKAVKKKETSFSPFLPLLCSTLQLEYLIAELEIWGDPMANNSKDWQVILACPSIMADSREIQKWNCLKLLVWS